MKKITTMAFITIALSSQAQYFRQWNNLSAASFRNEQFFSGIKTSYNYAAADSNKYYFVGVGVSHLNAALPAPNNVADRMRFTRISYTGAVSVNNGYEFADAANAFWFNSAAHSVAEIAGTTGTPGYISVGQVSDNTAQQAVVPGGSDMLFTRLSAAGAITNQFRVDLQNGYDVATCVRASKYSPGKFLVCGYSNHDANGYRNCFVMSISTAGVIGWSRTFNFDPTAVGGVLSASCMAFSLCENPVTGRIYVTGIMKDNAVGATTDGLVFALSNTGALLWTNRYDTGVHDQFKSIKYSATNSLIITGYTNVASNYFNAFLLKLDTIGNFNWMEKYDAMNPATNSNCESKAFDVIERINTAGNLEYYIVGALNTTAAIKRTMVIKTNNLGANPFQFTYDTLATDTSMAIDQVANWFAKPGFCAFSNTLQPATGAYSDSYSVKAYYNGCTCKDLCPGIQISCAAWQVGKVALPNKKYTTYTKVQLQVNAFNYIAVQICNQANSAGGNNAKHSVDQGLSETATMNIFPVPAQNNVTVELNEIQEGNCTIEIYDMSGRKMFSTEQNVEAGQATFELNISQLTDGLYIMNVKNGSTDLKKRFMKN